MLAVTVGIFFILYVPIVLIYTFNIVDQNHDY